MRFTSYCNNKAHELRILGVCIMFSYETPIAAVYMGDYMRVANSWGPTTGKHFNQLGCKNFPEVSEAELHNFIHASLTKASLRLIQDKMGVHDA